MTGPEHYAKAQEHLASAAAIETDGYEDSISAWHQRQAQVHATLALAADASGERISELEQTVSVYGELIDTLRNKVYALERGQRWTP
jgi:hypothetical protein